MNKQLTIRFYFESGIKKYKAFRESPWYKAIFNTLHEKDANLHESIIALDIATYIKKNNPRLFDDVDKSEERLGKKIGACLSQLKNWEIFKASELEDKSIRQKLYQLNDRHEDYLKENITRVFLS